MLDKASPMDMRYWNDHLGRWANWVETNGAARAPAPKLRKLTRYLDMTVHNYSPYIAWRMPILLDAFSLKLAT